PPPARGEGVGGRVAGVAHSRSIVLKSRTLTPALSHREKEQYAFSFGHHLAKWFKANMSIKGILSAAGIVGFISIFLVAHFYPTVPRSFLGWVALFFLGIPAWVKIESTGESVLSAPFFK